MNAASTDPTGVGTIVMIHGLWMTPRSWEHWAERYRSKGYTVLTPAWPGMEVEVEALNADPSPLEKLDVDTIVDHYEQLIRELDSPPIIMGHSFGGGFTQILLDRGVGAAGVGVAPATVKGVRDLPLSTLRASAPLLSHPFRKYGGLNEKQFHYAFANTLSQEESDKIRERYAVPGPTEVLKEGAFANFMRHAAMSVNFENEDRAPMLFIAFEHDHIIPPKVARHNAEKYTAKPVEFKEFPDRPHFPGVSGWEEVADYALDWATTNATPGGVPISAAVN
jgi:pimeloyl-ACP methyl ester carboxylesterase